MMESIVVTGATVAKNLARLILLGVPHRPGMAARVFGALTRKNIIVDDIVQSAFHPGSADMTFTVSKEDLDASRVILDELDKELGFERIIVDENIAKVSVVGVGMRTHTGVAQRMFKALSQARINIQNITTSEIKISCIINREQADRALQVVHDAFELEKAR